MLHCWMMEYSSKLLDTPAPASTLANRDAERWEPLLRIAALTEQTELVSCLLDHAADWSEAEPTSNATDRPVSIVPQLTQGSFSEVRRALFGPTNEPTDTELLSPSEEEEPNDDGPWIINTEASALLDELEEVDFDDVPVCSCGRYCDVQTLDDAWHCSHCDPNAEERRKRTQRLLAATKRIRRENGLSDSNVTHADPQP